MCHLRARCFNQCCVKCLGIRCFFLGFSSSRSGVAAAVSPPLPAAELSRPEFLQSASKSLSGGAASDDLMAFIVRVVEGSLSSCGGEPRLQMGSSTPRYPRQCGAPRSGP